MRGVHAVAGDGVEEIGDRAAAGQLGLGLHVVPGGEDEGALVGARVGEGEDRVVGDDVGVRDDVDVEGAGAPALVPDAVEGLLDRVRPLQERGRRAASS